MPRKTPASRRHVALLRGINVGGKNKLPSAALVEMVEGLGVTEVSTYIQSGNVIFTAAAAQAKKVSVGLHAAIAERFGYDIPVVVRSAVELRQVVENNPFVTEGAEGAKGAEPSTLHVAFLADVPTAAAAAGLDPKRSPPDAFVLRGRDLFLHLPGGVAKTKLTNAYLDRVLGTVSTVRNWRTVQTLLELAEGS